MDTWLSSFMETGIDKSASDVDRDGYTVEELKSMIDAPDRIEKEASAPSTVKDIGANILRGAAGGGALGAGFGAYYGEKGEKGRAALKGAGIGAGIGAATKPMINPLVEYGFKSVAEPARASIISELKRVAENVGPRSPTTKAQVESVINAVKNVEGKSFDELRKSVDPIAAVNTYLDTVESVMKRTTLGGAARYIGGAIKANPKPVLAIGGAAAADTAAYEGIRRLVKNQNSDKTKTATTEQVAAALTVGRAVAGLHRKEIEGAVKTAARQSAAALKEHDNSLCLVKAGSFFKEKEKSASRWKQLLRAGKIDSQDVRRLVNSGVLNFDKEIAGLEAGSTAIAKKHDIGLNRVNLKDLVTGQNSVDKTLKNINVISNAASRGGFATSQPNPIIPVFSLNKSLFPAEYNVHVVPEVSPLLKGVSDDQTKRGVIALATRHEVNEAKAAQNSARKAKFFIVGDDPKTIRDRIGAFGTDIKRNILKRFSNVIQEGKETPKEVAQLYRDALKSSTPAKAGTITRNKHKSPDVILRESADLASLPPDVFSVMLPHRAGEIKALKRVRPEFSYGSELSSKGRNDILKAFARDEI
jgi:hypothetical protein